MLAHTCLCCYCLCAWQYFRIYCRKGAHIHTLLNADFLSINQGKMNVLKQLQEKTIRILRKIDTSKTPLGKATKKCISQLNIQTDSLSSQI